MKASRFSESQIAYVLRQAEEGTAIGEVCRSAGISEATFYNWRKKYGGLLPSEMKRLKQMEEENNKLKKLVADLSLDKAMLQDVIKKKAMTPARRRHVVDELRDGWRVSIRRACSVIEAVRASYHYKAGDLIACLCKAGSRRLQRRECAMVTGASMCFCVVKAGR